jgi:hypothetical protein
MLLLYGAVSHEAGRQAWRIVPPPKLDLCVCLKWPALKQTSNYFWFFQKIFNQLYMALSSHAMPCWMVYLNNYM